MPSSIKKRSSRTATDITRVKGVGPAMTNKLAAMGINSAIDLLFHLPLRYEDRSRIHAISSLRNGMRVVVEGEVSDNNVQFGKRRSLVCHINDGSGILCLRFFYFSTAQQKSLSVGTTVRCFGEVSFARNGLNIVHPEYQIIEPDKNDSLQPSMLHDHLTAVYPSTEGIHQSRWRTFIQSAFEIVAPEALRDLISQADLQQVSLHTPTSLYDTLKQLHFPALDCDTKSLAEGIHPLQRRLAFEELIAQRLSHLVTKSNYQQDPAATILTNDNIEQKFLAQLPFALTTAQRKVITEIKADISQPFAMMRLLQGDVGSGKTIVAAIAALHCVNNNLQAAIMAPTEILAEQHAEAMSTLFEGLGFSVCLLTSKLPSAEKQAAIASISTGQAHIVVGTHALIQQDVAFSNLGLVVIDEQHRFGVDQRRALKNKRDDQLSVHQLVMTATPIPRTLAMTFYADLAYSVIDELPPGRTPVQTVAISNEKRNQVIERVRSACQQQRQVYWVCTLIDESEALECQAAETTATELASQLTDVKTGLIHGRLKAAQKQQVMSAFKQGELQLLVATTVIEVGVDVPNASLMIIENPERLGLAQLHQLRGRVGRGSVESHCVLLYQKPLSKKGKQRLDIMRQTNDGFKLSEQDLKMRGPGEVLGTRQSGATIMRLADLERDADMIDAVVKTSDTIFLQDELTAHALIQRWCPFASRYSNV